MRPKVDLSQLAVTRDAPAARAGPSIARRRNLLTRFVLPGLLLLGFAGLVGYAARETLSPPRAVTVIPVTTSQSAMDAPPDTPLFRAAGWVEPRPTPTVVTALAEGVVEQLLVVEGQEIKQGEVVARLITADVRRALESAEAEAELRESELSSARTNLIAAKARVELPTHLQAELADAETALARAESELAGLPSAMSSAEARLAYAKRDFDGARRSGTGVAPLGLDKAKSDMDASGGSLRELDDRFISSLPVV